MESLGKLCEGPLRLRKGRSKLSGFRVVEDLAWNLTFVSSSSIPDGDVGTPRGVSELRHQILVCCLLHLPFVCFALVTLPYFLLGSAHCVQEHF